MAYNEEIETRIRKAISGWQNTDAKKMFGGMSPLSFITAGVIILSAKKLPLASAGAPLGTIGKYFLSSCLEAL